MDMDLMDVLELDGKRPCLPRASRKTIREAAATITRLRAENERLKGMPEASEAVRAVVYGEKIDQLQARIAELEADAARYRWLRQPGRSHAVVGVIADNSGKATHLAEYALDRAIDAALSGRG
jgi:hypothetical protein